jgi:hypothetical protein
MKNLLDKIEKEIIGAPLPNEYRVFMEQGYYQKFEKKVIKVNMRGCRFHFTGFLRKTDDKNTDLYLMNKNSDIEDKYLIIANLFTGNLLMAVKGAYKGEIFLLEDGEEEECIPIAKNILSFIEQIAANL